MVFINLMVYQNGTVALLSPFGSDSEAPEYLTNVLSALPCIDRMQKITSDNITRWRLPIGWPVIPVVCHCVGREGGRDGWKRMTNTQKTRK